MGDWRVGSWFLSDVVCETDGRIELSASGVGLGKIRGELVDAGCRSDFAADGRAGDGSATVDGTIRDCSQRVRRRRNRKDSGREHSRINSGLSPGGICLTEMAWTMARDD